MTLDREVLDSKMVFPVISQALVEGAVLLSGDVGGVASPDGLGLVKLLVLGRGLLDLLGLLCLAFFIFDFLNLLVLALGDFLVVLDLLRFMQRQHSNFSCEVADSPTFSTSLVTTS